MKIEFKNVKINLKQMHNKDIIELIATIVLICILILVIISAVGKTKKRRYSTPKPITVALKKPAAVTIKKTPEEGYRQDDSASFRRLERETRDMQFSRDPFLPSRISIPTGVFYSDFRLTGIFWDDKTPSAIINGMVVRIGDEVGGNKIVGITPDSVILNDGLSDFSLKLEQ